MRMKNKKYILIRRTRARFQKSIHCNRQKRREIRGYEKFMSDVRRSHPKQKVKERNYKYHHQKSKLPKKPPLSENITYFLKTKNSFANETLINEDNVFYIPEIFSLSENYNESSVFLRKLFNALYKQSFSEIILDYEKCNQIDVDASICMDIILSDFIKYYEKCSKERHTIKVDQITPRNFDRYEIKKVLFSIGAFRNIKGFKIEFENIIEYPLCIGDKKIKDSPKIREVHITEMVDYIIACLARMNRNLTPEAEDNLYKVIGEVIVNAEEHSNTSRRYSVGYFESTQKEEKHIGIFNLAILNVGNTIYETFKSPDCKNYEVIKNMESLSEKYTKRNLFKKSKFEEETLWTLYALQEGVTSKQDWKRGNGSIRFIESFFRLKGNKDCDGVSLMTITSGNTRIIFDGFYDTIEKIRGKQGKTYKLMTFNTSGNIEDLPDEKYVNFAENYFPGTLITAKICIDHNNTENI